MTPLYHPNFPPSLSIIPSDARFTRQLLRNGEDVFGVEAQRDAIFRYGIAGRIWEAAYMLCAYVDPTPHNNDSDVDPPFAENPSEPLGVIELGSGTGVVAASVARAIQRAITPGGFVIATDLLDVCPLLQCNLGVNTSLEGKHSDSDTVFVRPLAWGNLDHVTSIASEFGSRRLTHVVCSDLVYFPELLGPLLRTLIHLTSLLCTPFSGPRVKIVISYKARSLEKETPFWSAFGLWFSFRPVLMRRVPPFESENALLDDERDASGPWIQFGAHEYADQKYVFVAHRRPESMSWHAPDTDKELMEGVGACDTTTKKGDDTFETILFMAMGIDDIGE